MSPKHAYQLGLERNDANFVALSPLSFLERSAQVYPNRVSVVYDERSYTWRQTYDRCRQLASALRAAGVEAPAAARSTPAVKGEQR